MPKLLRAYMDFRGGLNVDTADDNLADNELMVAENIDLDERGGFSKRKGTQLLNPTPYWDTVWQLIEWKRTGSQPELLAVIGTTLGKLVPPDYTFSGIAALASNWVRAVGWKDKGYFLDGSNFYFYDGTTWGPVGENPDPSCDLGPIRRCRFLLWHPKSFRFFAAGNPDDDQALYYSEPGDPSFWKATSKLYPVSGHGPVQGLALFADAVLVFYEDSIWLWRGIDPQTDQTWERLPIALGVVVEPTITHVPGALGVLARSGVWALLPPAMGYTTIVQPGEGIAANLAENRIMRIIRSIRRWDLARAAYDAHRGRWMIAINDNESLGYNNYVLVFDWGVKAWTLYTGWAVQDLLYRPSTGELLIATGRNIERVSDGYADHGTDPIVSRVATKYFNLGYPFWKKRFLRLYMAFKQELRSNYRDAGWQYSTAITGVVYRNPNWVDAPSGGEWFELSASIVVDHRTEYRVDDVRPYEGMVWGDPWGSRWGAKDFLTTRSKVSASGHRVQLRLQHDQVNVPMTFYGLAIEFRPIRAKGKRLEASADV